MNEILFKPVHSLATTEHLPLLGVQPVTFTSTDPGFSKHAKTCGCYNATATTEKVLTRQRSNDERCPGRPMRWQRC